MSKSKGEVSRQSSPPIRYQLTDSQLRELNSSKIPALKNGKWVLVDRPSKDKDGNPIKHEGYRIRDGNPLAPRGFGVYVGARGCTYDVLQRVEGGHTRFKIGKADLRMGQLEAYRKAEEEIGIANATNENPRIKRATDRRRVGVKRITVAECFDRYLASLRGRKTKQLKESSLDSIEDSEARLARPEVGLANKEIRQITKEDVLAAFDNLRISAMNRSNRLPTPIKEKLAGVSDWAKLTDEKLAALGIKGKMITRVRAAGIAATEHTFAQALRAVRHVIEEESELAVAEQRAPDLFVNPFNVLLREKKFRGTKELDKHYRTAEVRNPLGTEDKSLPRVLKTIIARRDEQGGHNRAGADYLLLTLLFGARRGECAKLKWFDLCTPEELRGNDVSWVWLGGADEINPITKKRGPQVYFHDTKSNDEHFLPVSYFAERVLKRRLSERHELVEQIPRNVEAARRRLTKLRAELRGKSSLLVKDVRSLKKARSDVKWEAARADNLAWVFPARSRKAASGHYSDSKSILRNVRRDAGMVDLDKEVDVGLTPHDLRRTLGRYAARLLGGRIASILLHHKLPVARGEAMAPVSERYTAVEWYEMQEAMAKVEEDMIASSPRVWNRLKGADKPSKDEVNDPPAQIFTSKKEALTNDA